MESLASFYRVSVYFRYMPTVAIKTLDALSLNLVSLASTRGFRRLNRDWNPKAPAEEFSIDREGIPAEMFAKEQEFVAEASRLAAAESIDYLVSITVSGEGRFSLVGFPTFCGRS